MHTGINSELLGCQSVYLINRWSLKPVQINFWNNYITKAVVFELATLSLFQICNEKMCFKNFTHFNFSSSIELALILCSCDFCWWTVFIRSFICLSLCTASLAWNHQGQNIIMHRPIQTSWWFILSIFITELKICCPLIITSMSQMMYMYNKLIIIQLKI